MQQFLEKDSKYELADNYLIASAFIYLVRAMDGSKAELDKVRTMSKYLESMSSGKHDQNLDPNNNNLNFDVQFNDQNADFKPRINLNLVEAFTKSNATADHNYKMFKQFTFYNFLAALYLVHEVEEEGDLDFRCTSTLNRCDIVKEAFDDRNPWSPPPAAIWSSKQGSCINDTAPVVDGAQNGGNPGAGENFFACPSFGQPPSDHLLGPKQQLTEQQMKLFIQRRTKLWSCMKYNVLVRKEEAEEVMNTILIGSYIWRRDRRSIAPFIVKYGCGYQSWLDCGPNYGVHVQTLVPNDGGGYEVDGAMNGNDLNVGVGDGSCVHCGCCSICCDHRQDLDMNNNVEGCCANYNNNQVDDGSNCGSTTLTADSQNPFLYTSFDTQRLDANGNEDPTIARGAASMSIPCAGTLGNHCCDVECGRRRFEANNFASFGPDADFCRPLICTEKVASSLEMDSHINAKRPRAFIDYLLPDFNN